MSFGMTGAQSTPLFEDWCEPEPLCRQDVPDVSDSAPEGEGNTEMEQEQLTATPSDVSTSMDEAELEMFRELNSLLESETRFAMTAAVLSHRSFSIYRPQLGVGAPSASWEAASPRSSTLLPWRSPTAPQVASFRLWEPASLPNWPDSTSFRSSAPFNLHNWAEHVSALDAHPAPFSSPPIPRQPNTELPPRRAAPAQPHDTTFCWDEIHIPATDSHQGLLSSPSFPQSNTGRHENSPEWTSHRAPPLRRDEPARRRVSSRPTRRVDPDVFAVPLIDTGAHPMPFTSPPFLQQLNTAHVEIDTERLLDSTMAALEQLAPAARAKLAFSIKYCSHGGGMRIPPDADVQQV